MTPDLQETPPQLESDPIRDEQLFANSITAMILVDEQRIIRKANKRFCALFGYSNEEIVGCKTALLTPTRTHFEEYKKYFDQTRDGSYQSSELQYRKKHGELFWVKLTGIPLAADAGRFILWSFDDISFEVEARQEIENRYLELEIIFNRVPAGLLFVVDGKIERVNPYFLKLVGQEKESLTGNNISLLLEDFEEAKKKNSKKLVTFQTRDTPIVLEREIEQVSANSYIVIFLDVTEHVQEKKALLSRAQTDGLTTIYNRSTFMEMAQKMMTDPANGTISFIMLDVDHFKEINDLYGHDVGDDVLRELTGLLKKYLRSNEIFGRLGGEEFGIALPLPKEQALAIATRLLEAIRCQTFTRQQIEVTVSMGMVDSSFSPLFDAMYRGADRLMYIAKRAGRNRLQY
ncbi:sensor domain-containing diguanylate cyclase [Desulfogranum mediterraneum]|uniref:sensor domain-containing diguanylate cyclase n=1 Tax=Desulfogranum mediterraneum TaxID=160661 RepID=UPI0003F9D592|nr:diguanylate cyclase [Desulfogranum mediterraneum]